MWNKLVGLWRGVRAWFDFEARRQARWAKHLQITALESEQAELVRHLQALRRRQEAMTGRHLAGVVFTETDLQAAKTLAGQIEVTTAQRQKLALALAQLKGNL